MSESLVDSVLRRQRWLDPVGDVLHGVIDSTYHRLGRPGAMLRSAAHGTRVLGHPLHPALSDLPVGAWITAVVADYVAHFTTRLPTQAGDVALAVALVGAFASAATGFTDFCDTYGHERRVVVSHGLGMTGAVLLGLASMGLRWWAGGDLHGLAVGLSTGGLALLLAAAYLGGHAVFGIGTMVNHLAFQEGPEEPVAVGLPGDFPEGEMRRVDAGGMAVLLVRRGGVLWGLADVCSHAGGPLHEGTLEGNTVVCPWHGSRFRLDTGRPLRGPATFPQPTFTITEDATGVTVRLGPPTPRPAVDLQEHRRPLAG